MRVIFAFVYKEFLHIFRDKQTLLLVLGIPVILLILFGFAISTEVKNVRVAVLTPTIDGATRQIINKINTNEIFTVVKYLQHTNDIEHVFLKDEADIVAVFCADFENKLTNRQAEIQWIVDATDPNHAAALTAYANGILAGYATTPIPSGISTVTHMLYNPQMQSAHNFVPGVMGLILMLMCAMMTSISIVREKETGTMDLLLTTPVTPFMVLFSKMIPYFILSCANLASILIISVYVLDVPVAGSLGTLVGMSMVYVVAALALGVVISTKTRTQMAAMLISAGVLMVPVIMLSGMIFPTENLPLVLRVVACIVPAKWYIEATKKLMIQGLSFEYVYTEITVLTIMAVALIGFSLITLKRNNK
jgi:ABC-2 type transport system permease protein